MDRNSAYSSGDYEDEGQREQYHGERRSTTGARHEKPGQNSAYSSGDYDDGERRTSTGAHHERPGRNTSGDYEDEDRREQYDDGERRATTGAQHGQPGRKIPSTSELMSSAKIVADAAMPGGEKVDKARVSEAASNILSAAGHYGKLDEKEGLGSYVGKAEDMLRKYGSGGGGGSHSSDYSGESGEHETKKKPSKKDDEDEDGGGAGYGDYLKMAQGFMKG